jgi:hypothetical protein
MNIKMISFAGSLLALAGLGQPAFAQDSDGEINNGTNPTLLATSANVNGQYTDIGGGLSIWEISPTLSIPFGAGKTMSLAATVPFSNTPFDNSFDIGDASVKFTHVLSVTQQRGIAYTVEFYMDTAASGRGFGEPVVEASGYYAMFLGNGSILAPALVQTLGVGNPTPADGMQDTATELYYSPTVQGVGLAAATAGKSVNTTTFDLYYVPKLKNPKLFLTFDPALVRDWRAKDTFGSLTVTFGSSIGQIGGGNLTLYAKPQVLMGSERPANWSMTVGTKLIGF